MTLPCALGTQGPHHYYYPNHSVLSQNTWPLLLEAFCLWQQLTVLLPFVSPGPSALPGRLSGRASHMVQFLSCGRTCEQLGREKDWWKRSPRFQCYLFLSMQRALPEYCVVLFCFSNQKAISSSHSFNHCDVCQVL